MAMFRTMLPYAIVIINVKKKTVICGHKLPIRLYLSVKIFIKLCHKRVSLAVKSMRHVVFDRKVINISQNISSFITMAILTEKFNTPHDTAPFSQISEKDYLPAFEEAIALTKKEIEDIANNPEPPTFQNTIEMLAYSGQTLDRISNIFFNLHSADTNDEMEKIAQEVAPKLSALGNDITLNLDLFVRVKTVYEQKESLNLTPEQETLLNKSFKDFARNGALLDDDKKSKLRDIDAKLSVLKLKFGENVLADSNAYQLHLTNADDLKGLPEGVIEAAAALAKSEGKDGWIFTLDYPSYIP